MSFRLFALLFWLGSFGLAQTAKPGFDQALSWRMVGPHRAGRTVGAMGVPGQPAVFYIGVNNGGVWKTTDFGRTWIPIFDAESTGSVGDVAVAPSNPDVIYVGSGEGLQRPDLSVGDGIFKSVDGGRTWSHAGLGDAQQIGGVIVHPGDAETVFVAALGHPYGPNAERGVYKSTDGGATWTKSLYIDENTGAIQVGFDPNNPEVLYADLWAARQGPWENAAWEGETSGLYTSKDGGKTWRKLTAGLPGPEQGLGRIGFAIAPSDSRRMYATVDARENGGIYRSDDAGETWEQINTDRRVWGRGSDFAELKVHPRDKDTLFSANIAAYISKDGGRNFTAFKGAPGGDDYHRIWINPENPDIMLFAADQGAVVTVNGGETWSSWYNQPTAQLYHVSTDNQFPYFVYGGQQESGAIAVASRGPLGQITFRDWHSVGADEYAYVAPDPLDPSIVYGGRVTRFDRRTGQSQNVAPEAVRSGKYRILRTMPLIFSPVDKKTLFFATNVLFKTTTGGQGWEIVSPDLSRETTEVAESIGIFRTPELAGMRRRGVIYAVSPSPLDLDLIWAGTDDGLVHVTRDGGKSWENVTPPELTSWSKVSQIDAGHFDKETAYLAINRIRLDDMRPHIYRTHDGGRSWTAISKGLPENGPVNVVREDPIRPGLLFAGTERAVYVSFNDGDDWQSLRLNMPATSVRDLVVHGDDVVVGTHGRSIWILDNITPLRQLESIQTRPQVTAHLFSPQVAFRVRWNLNSDTPLPPEEPAGQNPPDGAMIDYFLAADAQEVQLEIWDPSGGLVRRFSSADEPEQIDPDQLPYPTYWFRPPSGLSNQAGLNRFVWDLHYPPPEDAERSHPIAAVYRNTASGPVGPWVHPGEYRVRLMVDGQSFEQPLTVRMDPRVTTATEDLLLQFDTSMRCYRQYRDATDTRRVVSSLRDQIRALMGSRTMGGEIGNALQQLDAAAAGLEGTERPGNPDTMYSSVTAASPGQETLGGLQSKFLFLMALAQGADVRPTTQLLAGIDQMSAAAEDVMRRWDAVKSGELARVNALLSRQGRPTLEPR